MRDSVTRRQRPIATAVEDNFIHVLFWFRLPVAIYVLDSQSRRPPDADAKRVAERHNIDRFTERANSMIESGLPEGWRSDDKLASPTAQKARS